MKFCGCGGGGGSRGRVRSGKVAAIAALGFFLGGIRWKAALSDMDSCMHACIHTTCDSDPSMKP